MGKLVGVFQTAHTPFCYRRPEDWNQARSGRELRADVPLDDLESNRRKYARVQEGFAVLRRKLEQAGPEVIVVFGDDQLECFDFCNYPAFSIYVGEEFSGTLAGEDTPIGALASSPPKRTTLKGHPELGVALLTGLMKRGIDPAFCMDMPKPEEGIGHAVMRPGAVADRFQDADRARSSSTATTRRSPPPRAATRSAGRCAKSSRNCRADLRIAIVGSGGLWHTPRKKQAWLNEAFDEALLGCMARGDIRAMAACFDEYQVPAGDASQDIGARGREVTGMPGFGGPQGGTRETCNWIAAAGAVEGTTATIVDRVPIYASPIDAAFAYFNI